MDLIKVTDKIVDWIKQQVQGAGAQGVTVGLSGGIDSSVTAILCKRAFPGKILGVLMPCFSNPQDLEHAENLAKKFEIPTKKVDLCSVVEKLLSGLEEVSYEEVKGRMEVANLKPRLRMASLYYFANKLNYLVVGTDNKSEELIGYFTKYGDGGVDILPLVNLYKRDVRELASYLQVPEEIINKKPSAGLWEGQTDEDEMGISYGELDEILERLESGKDLSDLNAEKVEKVKQMISGSEHKRRMPPGCNLSE